MQSLPETASADEAPPPADRPPAPVPSPRRFGWLFGLVETLLLTLVIFVVIQNFVAQPYTVQQVSMQHTVEPGQYVLVDKLTKNFDDYKRGDIIVFEPPAGYGQADGTPYIKRVIGIENDAVEIRDGQVFVNGVPLDEPYVFDGQDTLVTGVASSWVIPTGQLFVMGDHRYSSTDSRVFGPVEKSKVVGRAWLRYWPLSTFGVLPTPTYPELTAAP